MTDKKTVILIDEADKQLIDDRKKPPTQCKVCIGFTATIPSHDQTSCFETRWLQSLNFSIKSDFGYDQKLKKVDYLASSLSDFFNKSRAAAKLIWCDDTKEII